MKIVYTVIFLFITPLLFAQSNYSRGFQEGYKNGYCYNQGYSCIPPIPPNTPIPRIRENLNSYQDGYNRGLNDGIMDYKNNSTNSRDDRQRYQTSEGKFVENKMYISPVELMAELIKRKDKEFEEKYGSIENRNRIFEANFLQAEEELKNRNYYQAINYCNKAEETLLTNTMIDLIKGESYYHIGNYHMSMHHLKKAKNNGYRQAQDYINKIKNLEKEMVYVKSSRFGVKAGINFSDIKSSFLIGLFLDGLNNNTKFSVTEEILYYRNAQYETRKYSYSNSSKNLEVDNQILQMNILGRSKIADRINVIYGPGVSFLINPAEMITKFDLNAGAQYSFNYKLFSEFRINKNIGNPANTPNVYAKIANYNLQFTLGYKF